MIFYDFKILTQEQCVKHRCAEDDAFNSKISSKTSVINDLWNLNAFISVMSSIKCLKQLNRLENAEYVL